MKAFSMNFKENLLFKSLFFSRINDLSTPWLFMQIISFEETHLKVLIKDELFRSSKP